MGADLVVNRTVGLVEIQGPGQQRDLVAAIQCDAAIASGQRSTSDPHHFTGGEQCVEEVRCVIEPRRQNITLECRRRQRGALKPTDRLQETARAGTGATDAVPRREERPQRGGIDGFDLASKHGERPAAESAQDIGIDPLGPVSSGAERSTGDPASGFEIPQRSVDRGRREPQLR